MQPNGQDQQNQGQNQPQHVPISQLKEQIAQASSNQNSTKPSQQPAPSNSQTGVTPSNVVGQQVISPTAEQQVQQAQSQQATPQPQASGSSTSERLEQSTDSQQQTGASTPAEPNEQASSQNTAANNADNQVNVTDGFIRGLVYLQFFSIAVLVVGFFPGPLFLNTNLMIAGALMMGLGIYLGVWAIMSFGQKVTPNPRPKKHSFLVTGGPYKYMRHPMYSALLLFSIGITLIYPSITKIIALAAIIFVVFTKMGIEEYLLNKRYSHYARYQRLTGRIFPKFKKPDIDIDLPKFER